MIFFYMFSRHRCLLVSKIGGIATYVWCKVSELHRIVFVCCVVANTLRERVYSEEVGVVFEIIGTEVGIKKGELKIVRYLSDAASRHTGNTSQRVEDHAMGVHELV